MSPVPAARSVSSRMRSFSPAVNVRRLGRSDNSGLAAVGAGTTVGLPPSSVPAPTAACTSTTVLGMTTRQFSYALKSKLPGSLCLIIIGTEGTLTMDVHSRSAFHSLLSRLRIGAPRLWPLSPKLHTSDCSFACPGSSTWVDKVPSRDTPSLDLADCQGNPDSPQVARNQSR